VTPVLYAMRPAGPKINADLRRLSAGHGPPAAERLDVLYRPIPRPSEGEEG
jgi:hypothetical protein